jgi:glutamate 5-kinase
MRNSFGDNDKLAALAAVLLKVDILIPQPTQMEFTLNPNNDKTLKPLLKRCTKNAQRLTTFIT